MHEVAAFSSKAQSRQDKFMPGDFKAPETSYAPKPTRTACSWAVMTQAQAGVRQTAASSSGNPSRAAPAASVPSRSWCCGRRCTNRTAFPGCQLHRAHEQNGRRGARRWVRSGPLRGGSSPRLHCHLLLLFRVGLKVLARLNGSPARPAVPASVQDSLQRRNTLSRRPSASSPP